MQHSNGVVTSYGCDEVNHLEGIVATNSAGAPITRFVYTLGPTGNRKDPDPERWSVGQQQAARVLESLV